MNEQRESGMFWMGVFVILSIIGLALAFSSCGTKREYIETVVYKHDTLRVNHTDTIKDYKIIKSNDTVKIVTERVVTLIQPEDKSLPPETIRVDNNTNIQQISKLTDSISEYKSIVDKLLRSVESSENQKQKVVIRKVAWQEYVMFIVFCILMAGGVGLIIKRTQ